MSSEQSSELELIRSSWDNDGAYYSRLIELYELDSCVKWILANKFVKVCVQFPESLLIDSVDIASYIESNIGKKVYILGDTAYGSCCVDEVGAQHVNGDCIVHFGHACLSPVSMPTFYIFLKRSLNVNKLLDIIEKHPDVLSPIFILYDVAYSHHIDALRNALGQKPYLKKTVCIPELELEQNLKSSTCSNWCFLQSSEYSKHCTTTLQRSYCPHPNGTFQSMIYIGAPNANLFNFTYVFKDCKMYTYKDNMDNLEEVCKACITKQISYMVEKIRSAGSVGIIVASLSVQGYKEAVEHAKLLCLLNGKKSYILAIGKPTPAKIANFSEMDIFVAISCPESDFGDRKQYMQPIVGLYELDLALNRSRPWVYGVTRDFRDVIKGVNLSRSWSTGLRTGIISKAGSYDSVLSSSWSFASVSTTSMPRLATAASMKAAGVHDASILSSEEMETYNINELIAQMNATRNAQSLVHQMKRLSKEDVARMKAYQITLKKPEKDAFEKHYFSDRKKQEFWAHHRGKQRATTVLDSFPLPGDKYKTRDRMSSQLSYEYQMRDGKIKNKLKEIETLSLELAELLESQERIFSHYSSGGRSYIEPVKERREEEEEAELRASAPDEEDHSLNHIIPHSVLNQLTRPSTSHNKEWKGLEQNLGEDPPAVLKEGRKGGPQTSYNSEPKNNK